MKIALLTPTFAANDAVGTDMLKMAEALARPGTEVRLFADRVVAARNDVHRSDEVVAWLTDADDVLIYHHSVAWPPVIAILDALKCRRLLRYHNVTPHEFFYGISHDYMISCAKGREETNELARMPFSGWLADSQFNKDELVALGVPAAQVQVLAPLNRTDDFLRHAPDAEFLRRFRDGRSNLLMVGRIAPNKGHAELIDAFACHVRNHDREARLLIVGKQDYRLATYRAQLLARIEFHGVGGSVVWLDNISDAQLRACYQLADAMLYLSAHEGFGVPLVEAMALSLPVVAYAAAATPETLGDAGLLWDSTDPRLYALSLQRLKQDADLRAQLVEAGLRRYREHFHPDVLAARLRDIVGIH